MNLIVRSIQDPGDPVKERLILRATGDVEIGEFMVLRTKIDRDGEVLAETDYSFWFPDRVVKKGDWVVLYTKRGDTKQKAGVDGSTTYFYYWNMSATVWNASDRTPVLMHIDNWKALSRPRTGPAV